MRAIQIGIGGMGKVWTRVLRESRAQGWEIAACLAYGSATASLYISRPADRFPDRPAVEAATSQYGIALPPGTAGR